MLGNNDIILCTAEMEQAVQWYLNEKVLRPEQAVTVVSVHESNISNSMQFRVVTQRQEPAKETK